MAVTATLCGMNTFADIEDFCELQIEWFARWIKIPHGVPTAQTFANLFALKGNQSTLHKEAIDHFHIALRHL